MNPRKLQWVGIGLVASSLVFTLWRSRDLFDPRAFKEMANRAQSAKLAKNEWNKQKLMLPETITGDWVNLSLIAGGMVSLATAALLKTRELKRREQAGRQGEKS